MPDRSTFTPSKILILTFLSSPCQDNYLKHNNDNTVMIIIIIPIIYSENKLILFNNYNMHVGIKFDNIYALIDIDLGGTNLHYV